MTFDLKHQRAIMGNDITIKVLAGAGENIVEVTTALDGFALATDSLDPSSVQYERVFPQAGDASVGRDHTLTVSVTDQNEKTSAATQRWSDS